MEPDEDEKPISDPIQSKAIANYEVGKKPKAQKNHFDLIWPRLTKSAYDGYMMCTHSLDKKL